MTSPTGGTDQVLSAKQALMFALADKWALYLVNMKLWFRKKHSREEFDIECRKLFTPDQVHLHNQFLLAILNKIDAVTAPQTAMMASAGGSIYGDGAYGTSSTHHGARSSKKRKRSSRSSSDRATFEPASVHDFISRETAELNYESMVSQSGTAEPTIRYAAQELFLPDNGLVLGRLLVGAWENGLTSVDDGAVELIVNSVQVLLKNIIMALVMRKKHYKTSANGTFIYDVGHQLAHPFNRNTVTRTKVDDEPMDLDKEITTVCYLKPMPTESAFLASCGEVYSNVTKKITTLDLYKVLLNRNIIPSHSVYSMNMERISSRLS